MDFIIWTNCLGNQTHKKPLDSFAFKCFLLLVLFALLKITKGKPQLQR